MNALRPLLSGIVDYAGLFPPSGLDMPAVVRNYAEYRRDPDAWMLGRLVIPASRLDELALELRSLDGDDEQWLIACLLGDDFHRDLETIDAFNAEFSAVAHIDTLEGKFTAPDAIVNVASAVGGRFALFAEVPIDRDPLPLIQAIAAAGVNAKIRTGGVTPEVFPAAADIVRFMRRCAELHVPFKATAGLHHPLRVISAHFRRTAGSHDDGLPARARSGCALPRAQVKMDLMTGSASGRRAFVLL